MSLNNKTTLSLVAGAFFALFAWILVDFTPIFKLTAGQLHTGQLWRLALVQLPVTAIFGVFVGLGIGSVNGLSGGSVFRLKRDALYGGACGLLGGIVGIIYGQAIFGSLYIEQATGSASAAGPLIFLWNVAARALGWAFIGLFIGVSQGLPSKSAKTARHGAVGGFIGGLIGGMLFQILPFIPPFGENEGIMARGISFTVTGGFIGLFIGLVQSLMRQAWIRVVAGRNEGQEYIISKSRTTIGRDELSDIGLFGDLTISLNHAVIDAGVRGRHVLRDAGSQSGTRVNGVAKTDHILRDGEVIEIGNVRLEFHEKATMSRVPKKSDVASKGQVAIPVSPNQCPYCGGRKDPVTGACACSVSDQQAAGAQDILQVPQPMPVSQTQTTGVKSPSIADGIPRIQAIGGPYIGQKFQLERSGTTTIGRDGGQNVNLPVDTTVSRRHARIVNEGGRFIVYDEGSSNGTTVNGRPISSQEIVPGDTVSFGSSSFRFEI
ncbi:MAG TPA: FHA domain-containing protein [Armatimonadota bacterium]|jgi:pSer/pThr/pTyr-binding forkhead associated (FHA) protein